jgi:hypothetical protein
MKHITFILFLVLPFLSLGQEDNSKKKYEYEICIYHKENEHSQILENKLIGIADTTIAFVSGTILDYKEEPLSFSGTFFIDMLDNKKHFIIADSLGKYKISLPAGRYTLECVSVGYMSLKIENLIFKIGEIKEINIKLEEASYFKSHSIISDKPLSKRKLNRIKRRIKKGKQ